MKAILVGVDGSVTAMRAARLAAQLARSSEAQLRLCYVNAPVMSPALSDADLVEAVESRQTAYGESVLTAAQSELATGGLQVVTELAFGQPADELLRHAGNSQVEMVVVGSRGRNAMARMFLGSVSSQLAHSCEKPLLIVR